MTVSLLTLMVLIVAFGAEVGWLMADPSHYGCRRWREGTGAPGGARW
jgi:hypothetical protein